MIQSQSAAVIDLGTNSIKFILAEKTPENTLNILHERTDEIRIGAGISQSSPSLKHTAIEQVSDAIVSLIQIKNRHRIDPLRIVATSAAREAKNQNHLLEIIKRKTGVPLEILSGESEAYYIGQAIRMDAHYQKIKTLNSIDLGGGSLEWIHLKDNCVKKALSLPLGAVRLTEQFIKDPTQAILEDEIRSIEAHVKSVITKSNIKLSSKYPLLGSGGAFHILTHLLKPKSLLALKDIQELALASAHLPLQGRIDTLNIPAKRADIIPAALITIACFMKHFAIEQIEHSKCSLKMGILKEMLGL
jgi:exopolyphosphatase/guanosine-5'-triphosphate,3'-diphosphate pyrophosphatase